MPAKLTLGAEEEFHLVDLKTWRLCPRAPQVLSQLPEEFFKAELQRSTIETNTEVVDTLAGLRAELLNKRQQLIRAAASVGAGVAATGTAPRSDFNDFEMTANGRFAKMQEQYRMLVSEQLICGFQVHVGLPSRDLAVQIAQRLERDLPCLLALSASSPYWDGEDTGYASIRTVIGLRWPSAGATGPLASAAEYDEMLADLVASGVISDEKMAYFDVRPSSKESTVELRICDSCPIVNDGVLIAGLFRAMVRAAEQDIEAGVRFQPRPIPIYRASMWQAARGGLSGKLLDSSPHAKPKDAATVIRAMVDRLRPQLEEAGDWDEIVELLETVLTRGNSADRQRTALADHGDLNDVMRSVIDETRSPAAGPEPESPPIPGYRVRAGDEAILRTGEPKPAYRPILNWLREQNADFIRGRFEARDKWVREHGLTFSGGSDDAFDIDLVPRVIQGHDWEELSQGLTQRARALELFIRDMYGEQRAVKDGILPDEFVQDIAGWRAEASRIPAGSVRAGIQGFDLVRNEFGGWRILEDNLRCPSGMAYGTSAREMLNEIMPDMPRLEGLIDPRNAFKQLRETLLSGLDLDGTAVLLTNGPENSAWFEHKTLADGAGLLLVQANDLNRSGDRIVHGETGRNIDAIYLRLDDPLIDASKKDGQSIGADILDIAAAGKVRIINPPGNGVGDDKAVYAFVPELIRYYLNESPLLEQVPTYRTQDPDERRIVLERVGQLVTKPVDGFGGAGVLVGPSASAAELAERRSAIPEHPDAWVAQEVVSLSSHPTFDDAKLAPRHLDLRVFVFLTGTEPGDARLADVALTRVAPPGSLVVNSSRGGGGKDTWIIAQNAGGRLQGNGKVH